MFRSLWCYLSSGIGPSAVGWRKRESDANMIYSEFGRKGKVYRLVMLVSACPLGTMLLGHGFVKGNSNA